MSYISGHEKDFFRVFEDIEGLDDIYREISTGMDSKNIKKPGLLDIAYEEGMIGESDGYRGTSFVRRFEDRFHSLPPKNHRIIGHWGLDGAIPFNQEPYKSALSMYPQNEVVDLWRTYVNDLVDLTVEKTGLREKQAKGLVGLIYDTHLLGDYSTVYTEPLQGLDALEDDIQKCLNRLFGNNNALTKDIKADFTSIPKNIPNSARAEQMRAVLWKHEIGERLYNSYGETLSQKGIKYVPPKPYLKAMKQNAIYANNITYFADSISSAVSKQPMKVVPQRIQAVNAVMNEVEIKGKKALILRVPFQFSTEQRAASMVAKKLIEERGVQNLTPDFLQYVREIAKQTAKETIEKTGGPIVDSSLDRIAEKAVDWAITSPTGAAISEGIAFFVITEGITVYRYFETDLSEKELMLETTKNLTGALLSGSATYCVVALGATPGGPVVIAVGIGVAVFSDFVFTRLEKEFSTPEFTFDDIIGEVAKELRIRRTVWEPNESDFSLFDYQTGKKSLFDYKSNQRSLFDYGNERKSLFDF